MPFRRLSRVGIEIHHFHSVSLSKKVENVQPGKGKYQMEIELHHLQRHIRYQIEDLLLLFPSVMGTSLTSFALT